MARPSLTPDHHLMPSLVHAAQAHRLLSAWARFPGRRDALRTSCLYRRRWGLAFTCPCWKAGHAGHRVRGPRDGFLLPPRQVTLAAGTSPWVAGRPDGRACRVSWSDGASRWTGNPCAGRRRRCGRSAAVRRQPAPLPQAVGPPTQPGGDDLCAGLYARPGLNGGPAARTGWRSPCRVRAKGPSCAVPGDCRRPDDLARATAPPPTCCWPICAWPGRRSLSAWSAKPGALRNKVDAGIGHSGDGRRESAHPHRCHW